MANIVDVVHKFTYDANTSPLQEVNNILGSQQKELEGLHTRYNALTAQQQKLAAQGIASGKLLNQQIELTKKKIDDVTASMGKQYAQNERLQGAVKRTAGQFDSLGFSLGNILRDLPYGFIGIANNIGPAFDDIQRKFKMLQAEGKGTGALFSSIGASLFGFTGIVNLVITGIQLLSTQLGGVTAATADLTKATEAGIAVNSEAAKLYAKEAAELGLLADEVANQATSTERLHEIRAELIKQAPALAQMLEGEENLSGRLFNAINLLTDAYKQQAIVKASLSLITKETERFLSGEIGRFNAFGAGIRSSFVLAFQGTAAFLQSAAASAGKQNQNQYEAALKNLTGILNAAQSKLNDTGLNKLLPTDVKTQKAIKETGKTLAELKQDIDALARSINDLDASDFEKFGADLEKVANDKLKNVQDALKELSKSFTTLTQSQFGSQLPEDQSSSLNTQLEVQADNDKLIGKSKQRINEEKQAQIEADRERAKVRMELLKQEYNQIKNSGAGEYDVKRARDNYKEARQQYKEINYDAKEGQRATIEAAFKGAQEVIAITTEVFNRIYDKQLEALDRQVSATQERISLAVELAKAGNATILQEETNRLDELNKKREEIAEKQLKTNAVLQASSAALAAAQAIQVVTNAGATGDPYTTAARIAAAVAALAAGVAFVTSLTDAFAEGVVDYKGKGTGTSDSNVVRISKGESVITAEATARHKDILEAMNAGTFDPNRLTPISAANGTINMKGLEKRMDEMIDVMSRSSTNVHANINEHGIYIATEKTKRRDQNRFRH